MLGHDINPTLSLAWTILVSQGRPAWEVSEWRAFLGPIVHIRRAPVRVANRSGCAVCLFVRPRVLPGLRSVAGCSIPRRLLRWFQLAAKGLEEVSVDRLRNITEIRKEMRLRVSFNSFGDRSFRTELEFQRAGKCRLRGDVGNCCAHRWPRTYYVDRSSSETRRQTGGYIRGSE